MKHDVHKRASALQTTRSLLHLLKTTRTMVHKRLQIAGEFSPTLCKFCMPLHCQASQTDISKGNSIKLSQTLTICRRKVGVVPPEKWGPKKFYICSVFRRLRDLTAKIIGTKHDIDNRATALETRGLLRCSQIL